MSRGFVHKYNNKAPKDGGEQYDIRQGSDVVDFIIDENCSVADETSSFTLSQTLPPRCEVLWCELRFRSAVGLQGNNGTSGTASEVVLSAIAPTSMATGVTTEYIFASGTTVASNTVYFGKPANYARAANTTTSAQTLYILPADLGGEVKIDVATDGYEFDGTADIHVRLGVREWRETPEAS